MTMKDIPEHVREIIANVFDEDESGKFQFENPSPHRFREHAGRLREIADALDMAADAWEREQK